MEKGDGPCERARLGRRTGSLRQGRFLESSLLAHTSDPPAPWGLEGPRSGGFAVPPIGLEAEFWPPQILYGTPLMNSPVTSVHSYKKVLRWVKDGVKGPDGDPIRLEAVKSGGRWYTSVQAVHRFIARRTAAAIRSESTTPLPNLGTGARYLSSIGLGREDADRTCDAPRSSLSPLSSTSVHFKGAA